MKMLARGRFFCFHETEESSPCFIVRYEIITFVFEKCGVKKLCYFADNSVIYNERVKNNEGEIVSIKASDLNLDHFMRSSERTGMRMRELQLLLTSADAQGMLCKDLITALGIERAKRFLLRYGYHCGVHEARLLKDSVQWQSDLDWLIAGSKMHHITGRVFSYPEKFRVDMEKGIFDVAGYWNDSFEATQYLKYFPLHNEPICYYMVGYASGYNTECMGKKVIFREMQCRGKGDDHCSYVGKTLEQWGDEIKEDLLFFEDDDMSTELDQMYRKVEQEKEKLKIGYALSRHLTQAMLQGKGFKTFAKLLGESLNCPVLIESNNFEPLAQYRGIPGLVNDMTVKDQQKKIDKVFRRQSVFEREPENKPIKLLTTAIMIKDKIHGYVTIASGQRFSDFHSDLLERTATTAALYMQNEQVALETEQRLKGDLLEQLINNKEAKAEDIHSRLAILGYDIREPHYVIHIEMKEKNKEHASSLNSDYLKIYNKFTDIFNFVINRNGPIALMLPKLDTVQAIISKKYIDAEHMTVKKFGERLLRELGGNNHRMYIGISEETSNLSDFYQKAVEAKKAVELAKVRSCDSKVILASELGHITLFLNARAPEELEAFAVGKLQTILDYDEKKKAELLLTLFYYSQNEFNLHKTARSMTISISGMRYRLQKIEDLLNIDLSNSNVRFEMQLALQILLMLGKINL